MREILQTLESGRYSLESEEIRWTLNSMPPGEPAPRPLSPALGVSAGRLSAKRCATRVILVSSGKLCTRWDIARGKLCVSPEDKEKRVAWCQARLHWTEGEWKRGTNPPFSTDLGAGLGLSAKLTRSITPQELPFRPQNCTAAQPSLRRRIILAPVIFGFLFTKQMPHTQPPSLG